MLFPFVQLLREKYDDILPNDNVAAMADKIHSVLWCDGNKSQIDTIVSPEGIQCYSDNNITVNKHNASGTGKEQACDLSDLFPTSNKLNRNTTVEQFSSSQHCMKRALAKTFAEYSKQD